MPYTVIIIEDQRMFRELLETMINRHPDFQVVATAENARDGWTLCETHKPDVALCDLSLPDESGLSLGSRIKRELPGISLLAVTSMVDPMTTTQVYDSGFHGYVEKDQSPEILVEAVVTVAEGGFYFTQLVRENRKRIFNDTDAINKILSRREQEIIGCICLGNTNRKIAEQMNISLRTVENHRYRITRRLGFKSSEELIEFGIRLGLNLAVYPRPTA